MSDNFVLPSDMDQPSSSSGNKDQPASAFVLPSDLGDDGKLPPPASTSTSLAASPFVGFNRGLADVAGAPVDAVNWAMGKVGLPTSQTPFGGSASIKQGLGLIGANPDDRAPRSEAERLLQAGGEGAAGMILPEAGLAGVGRAGLAAVAPRATEALQGAFGSASSVPAMATNAAAGASAGLVGQGALDAAPDRYKPLAALAGGLVGGGGTAAALHGAGVLGDQATSMGSNFVRPFAGKSAPVLTDAGVPIRGSSGASVAAKPGQLDLAAATLAKSATDPSAALDALQNNPRELIPGSTPTTGQVADDMGLAALEKTVSNSDNAAAAQFNDARAQQNSARVGALQGAQPIGDPTDVSKSLLSQLGDLDAQHSALDATAKSQQDATLNAAGGADASESIGNAARGSLADARAAVKDQENQLWNAVDPNKSLTVSMAPVQDAATDIWGSLPKADAATLSGPESNFSKLAGSYNSVEPFNELSSLRSNLAQSMRDELTTNGRSPAYRRLSMLMDSVHDVLGSAVDQAATHQAHAVTAGAMSPGDTMEAAIRDWAQAKYGDQDASAANRGRVLGAGSAADANPSGSGLAGAVGSSRWPIGRVESIEGIPEGPSSPATFDQAAADRVAAASAVTKERAFTFDNGLVGKILRNQGNSGAYAVTDSRIPGMVFKPGPEGYETAQSYLRAAGSQADGLQNIHDAGALSMRRAVMDKNGEVDAGKLASWKAAHADALRATPELATKIDNVEAATKTVNDLAIARKEAINDFQSGAVGKLIGATDETTVKRMIGGIFGQRDAVQQMRALAGRARVDPNAMQGLRKAIINHIEDKYLANGTAGMTDERQIKGAAFQTFMRDNAAVLEPVFSPDEIKSMQSIAADIQRSDKAMNAAKVAGSDTVPKGNSAKAHAVEGEGSLLSKLWKAVAIGGEAGPTGAIVGGIGAVGSHVIGGVQQAGLRRVNDLVKEAMLNPDLAQALLQRASKVTNRGSELTLAHKLKRISMFSAVNAAGQ